MSFLKTFNILLKSAHQFYKMKLSVSFVNSQIHIILKIKKCKIIKLFSEILVRIVNYKNYEAVLDELR